MLGEVFTGLASATAFHGAEACSHRDSMHPLGKKSGLPSGKPYLNGRFCIVSEIYCLECLVKLSYNKITTSGEMYNINKNCYVMLKGG